VQQTESEATRYASTGRSWYSGTDAPRAPGHVAERFDPTVERSKPSTIGPWASVILAVLGTLLYIISLPFRLVFWTVAWLGRMAVSSLGFVFMVLGIVLWAGSWWFFGILLFLIGLVLFLRSLH
jgi:hypothetical protein